MWKWCIITKKSSCWSLQIHHAPLRTASILTERIRVCLHFFLVQFSTDTLICICSFELTRANLYVISCICTCVLFLLFAVGCSLFVSALLYWQGRLVCAFPVGGVYLYLLYCTGEGLPQPPVLTEAVTDCKAATVRQEPRHAIARHLLRPHQQCQ